MAENPALGEKDSPPPIYIISGGAGASGEQVVHTALAQFPGKQVLVITFPHIRRPEQVDDVIAQAKKNHATVVHTLVEEPLRQYTITRAQENSITALDLIGSLLTHLAQVLGQQPLGHPGLYRRLHKDYFERVSAIEYTMAHDDGKSPQGWPQADMILLGVSRAGKTPLSLYLSVLGWKVANIPVVADIPLPKDIYLVDRRRVIGLYIEAGQLLLHRQQRQSHLGAPGPTDYTDPQKILEEVEMAKSTFRRNSFSVIDVTDKPIESGADEAIRIIERIK